MESGEDDEETQASFSRFLNDNFKLPISAYVPDCVPKVEIKERLIKKIKKNDCHYEIYIYICITKLKHYVCE